MKIEPTRGKPFKICGAPSGVDAMAIAELARSNAGLGTIYVARDDIYADQIKNQLAFFAAKIPVIHIPAWECSPYDRASPRREIVARRIQGLREISHVEEGHKTPLIVLTTVNALLQRLPPLDAFPGFDIVKGERLDEVAFEAFLNTEGYVRVDVVRAPGEYARRGGLIDLWATGHIKPARIDLFDDTVDHLRSFAPESQRSDATLDKMTLLPATECAMSDARIARFRRGYREAFGVINADDQLYEAISAGRSYGGMEHWLPLFHEHLTTLPELLPEASICLDEQAEAAAKSRFEQIEELYAARLQLGFKKGADGYRPLPPDRLYLTQREWQNLRLERAIADITAFEAPNNNESSESFVSMGGQAAFVSSGGQTGSAARLQAAMSHIVAAHSKKKRILVTAPSQGALERVCRALASYVPPVSEAALPEELTDQFANIPVAPRLGAVVKGKAGSIHGAVMTLNEGFKTSGLLTLTLNDILGAREARPRHKSKASDIGDVSAMNIGDLVVHTEHGIGKFTGLEAIAAGGAPHDCLRLVYADGDRLFLPVENMDLLSRYGGDDSTAALDKLGAGGWQARKARVKKRLLDLADSLLAVAAERATRKATVAEPDDGLWGEFCARFGHTETADQLEAIEDTLRDLASGAPMDRLICGDVGFGKTEVALRAAFVMAMSGRQVVIVTPTTLLARQHFDVFSKRFEGLPLKLGQLSRLVPTGEAKSVRAGLESGCVDIVIGTHALLAKSVSFQNLGLVIIDEEQHFGVKQKERMKELRAEVHVLSMTATPIPRTLNMAMAGLRDMSVIATPPIDKLAVRTFVSPFDPLIVREALRRERFRGGQSFVVCPRVSDLQKVEETLRQLDPELRIVTASGQMSPSALDAAMTAFYCGEHDVLLSTNIIESGIDIPRANTMIIYRANMFGLAQLYQLRGRVGRARERGYTWLTWRSGSTPSEVARKRLQIIESLDTLGAGFQLASHDMDMRGAGNLLGEAQSGHVREVGSELYQQMLTEAVEATRQKGGLVAEDMLKDDTDWSPRIQINVPVLLPETYVDSLPVRISLYKRLGSLRATEDIEEFRSELVDRFGAIPPEAESLLAITRTKIRCWQAGIEKLEIGPRGAVVHFRGSQFANVSGLLDYIHAAQGRASLDANHRLTVQTDWGKPAHQLAGGDNLAKTLARIANS